MKLLLDTHTLIWFLREPHVLRPQVLTAIEEAGKDVMVSIASRWGIAIKLSLNKLALPQPFDAPKAGLMALPALTAAPRS